MNSSEKTTGSIYLLDCTLRDGGYANNWDFSIDLINEYLHAMSTIYADYVEIGFRSFERNSYHGCCWYTTDNFIKTLDVPKDLKLGVMVNASELVTHPDGVIGALSLLFSPASESPISLVRIACHLPEFEKVMPGCEWLKEQGYIVGMNLMQISDRTPEEIQSTAKIACNFPIDVLYFADSFGGMDPAQTTRIIDNLKLEWSGPIGIHTHDNMGQAMANSLQAIKDGATWIDSTVTGMGRGPGNAKTEYLVLELESLRNFPVNITPLLSVIKKYFQPLLKKYIWGTNTYYYLAGKYGIHPTFIQEMLSNSTYKDEDIQAVIEFLRVNGGKKFSYKTIESGLNFYSTKPSGNWNPSALLSGRDVLIIGSGPGVTPHQQAIENYILTTNPVVIALNTQTPIKNDLITIRAASHPVRLLADAETHKALPQPLITPESMLPEQVRMSLKGKELFDFGLSIKEDIFQFNATFCTIPTFLVIAYVLAIAASGKASSIKLAGFDGYDAGDPRNIEMNKILTLYSKVTNTPSILAITPTKYKIPSISVYAL